MATETSTTQVDVIAEAEAVAAKVTQPKTARRTRIDKVNEKLATMKATTPVTITVIRMKTGDSQVHIDGCADIKRSMHAAYVGEKPVSYTGETLVAAIVEADTDLASAFGQKVYEPNEDDRPWTVTAFEWAPCFTKAVKSAGIEFGEAGRPLLTSLVEAKAKAAKPKATKPTAAAKPVKPEAPKKPRRIIVSTWVVVEVDIDALEAEYGHPFTTAEARDDVQRSIFGTASQAAYPEHSIDKIFVRTSLNKALARSK